MGSENYTKLTKRFSDAQVHKYKCNIRNASSRVGESKVEV